MATYVRQHFIVIGSAGVAVVIVIVVTFTRVAQKLSPLTCFLDARGSVSLPTLTVS